MCVPLKWLEFHCELEIVDGEQAVESCKQRIQELRRAGTPVEGCRLEDYGNNGSGRGAAAQPYCEIQKVL
jgi:hypothetical protein